ncbi:unnamed protein product [Cyclocybe aegerita]|uniref:Protein kinase domain-containing protein n=1 Tax=Cyclocybe aegerita TaxID=1973307 RepID=A0A8S0VZH2_CYCAE|nr:unnamed protein product [Cyclocybe aegerita]
MMNKMPPPQAQDPALAQAATSTPFSTGSGSHNLYQTQYTQGHYKPYLAADLVNVAIIPFDDFFRCAFNFDKGKNEGLSAKFDAIATSQECNRLLDRYKDEVGHETERYGPFNNLANHILAELWGVLPDSRPKNLVVCRNDHVSVKGSTAQQSPDCVAVPESVLSGHPDRMSCDNLSKGGPTEAAFHWDELPTFIEFKMEVKNLHTIPLESSTKVPSAPAGRASGSKTGSSSSEAVSRKPSRTSTPTSTPGLIPSPTIALSPAFGPTQSTTGSTSTSTGRSTSSSKRLREDDKDSVRKRARKDEDSPATTRADTLMQCASYALEMLSHGGFRTHVLGVLVTDDKLELLYYDHSITIRSESVCFTQDTASLVALLYCMQMLTPAGWGYVDVIGPPPLGKSSNTSGPSVSPDPLVSTDPSTAQDELRTTRSKSKPSVPGYRQPLHGTHLHLQNGQVLELGELIFRQHALIGRGSCVVCGKAENSHEWADKPLVVKFSFTPVTRISEGAMLEKIVELAKGDTENVGMLAHLPDVLHHEAVPPGDVQSRFSAWLKNQGIGYEDRRLQILVMTELFSIKELRSTAAIAPVFRDVFKCYKWLHEVAQVIHRDVSLNNIMYRKKEDGSACGVLSDFDLALFLSENKAAASTSTQRTGTKPYMAIDLLDNPKVTLLHRYRHDLESLFYVLVCLTTHEDNKDILAWPALGWQELAVAKREFLRSELPVPVPEFTTVVLWTLEMAEMFRLGYDARTAHRNALLLRRFYPQQQTEIPSTSMPEFKEETLGGHVDFDKFEAILEIKIDQ